MGIDRIASVNIFVNNLDAADDFYDGILSIPVGRRAPGLTSLYSGLSRLNIFEADKSNTAHVGRVTGIALRMRGPGELSGFVRRLESKGIRISERDIVPWADGAAVEVRDPEGNRFTLYETPNDRDDMTVFDGPSCVALRVKSLRKALEFYLGALEIPMIEQVDPYTAVFLSGGTQLIVTDRGTRVPAAPSEGETGICFWVSDPERLFDDLAGRGVKFASAPISADGVWLASVRDPDGNILNLIGKSA